MTVSVNTQGLVAGGDTGVTYADFSGVYAAERVRLGLDSTFSLGTPSASASSSIQIHDHAAMRSLR